ncbi:MAG: ribosome silencing factor [Acaryochloris sp. SU_5_25]|nr:ribosome silencing factor [Acaryochloris sp. SU_5_25]
MISQSSTQSTLSNTSPATDPAKALVFCLAEAADDRKGGDILVLNVIDISFLADYFVIVTGFSRTQVRAIMESMVKAAEMTCQRLPIRQEGKTEGTWVLLDYGDVIAHILMPEQREFYDLEAFWGHAQRLSWPGSAVTPAQD